MNETRRPTVERTHASATGDNARRVQRAVRRAVRPRLHATMYGLRAAFHGAARRDTARQRPDRIRAIDQDVSARGAAKESDNMRFSRANSTPIFTREVW